MKEYSCDLCGSSEAVEIPHVREYTNDQPVHICLECGFVYVRFRRSPEEVAASWNEIFQGHTGEDYTARIPAVKARHVYAADFLDSNLPLRGKTVCDIGAGEGEFLAILRDHYGASVFGVEPSAENTARLAGMGIEAFLGTAEDFAAEGGRKDFDVATVVWTLENCADCHGLLSAVREILVPGGHLLVATGSRILVPFKKTLHDYFGPNPADTHCFRWSAASLQTVLALNHFSTRVINRFQDSDVLCVIARKEDPSVDLPKPRDDPAEVIDFFERWHTETGYYS